MTLLAAEVTREGAGPVGHQVVLDPLLHLLTGCAMREWFTVDYAWTLGSLAAALLRERGVRPRDLRARPAPM